VIFLFIRQINKMKRQPEAVSATPTTKECAYCHYSVPINATRCPFCTSDLKGV
jgi:large conductance mechanosensitive channel